MNIINYEMDDEFSQETIEILEMESVKFDSKKFTEHLFDLDCQLKIEHHANSHSNKD